MANFETDARGGIDDRVRLQLGDDEVKIAETYEVNASILSQPSGFSLRLGNGDVAREILKRYLPLTPFKLYIGSVLQQSGNIDHPRAEGSTGATTITLRGRDALAPLHDAEIDAEESLSNMTYTDLVKRSLEKVGLSAAKLKASGEADRSIRAGVPVTQFSDPAPTDPAILTGSHESGGTTYPVNKRAMQTKLGESWFSFVRRYLDRAGFFLWAGADGSFILSAPNVDQKPIYKIVRKRGMPSNAVNVTDATFDNDTTHRHSVAVVYGRGGGRKHGRSKAITATTDDEMVNFLQEAFGIGTHRQLVIRDANVHTIDQAAFLGQRKLAEERRAGWRLEYTLAGHTTPALGTSKRAVWTPDTLVEVEDDEFGLHNTFWIESCEYKRGPETTTTIRLMRKTDLLFGQPTFEEEENG